jgi:hypothetical protein
MLPKRESLNSTKTRLSQELKNRTERRVRDLLRPRTTVSEEDIFDDSEEDNRLEGRRIRGSRDKETQTDSLSSSFLLGSYGWGVSCVVFVDLSCLVRCRCQTEIGKAKVRRSQEEAQGKRVRHVGDPLRLLDQSKKQYKRLSQSQRQRHKTVK